MAFDPDAFLGVSTPESPKGFDPDAFLAENKKPFNPDEFLGTTPDQQSSGFKDFASPFKIALYGAASGTMGITQAVKAGELQIASNLPEAGQVAMGAISDFISGGSYEHVSGKINAALSGPDKVKSQLAKDYLNNLRGQLNDLSQAMGNVQAIAKEQGGGIANDITFGVGAVVPQLAAIIPASASATLLGGPTAGLSTAAALSGIQTETSVFDEARQAYKAQGLTDEEAESNAYMPAALAGALTTGLTFLFPKGSEAISKTIAGRLAVKSAVRNSILKSMGAGFLDEMGEEGLDQLSQGIIAKETYSPEKPWTEVFQEAGLAGIVGGIVGGAVEGGTRLIGGGRENADISGPDSPENNLPTVSQIVDEAGGELLTPEMLSVVGDQMLQDKLVDTSQSRPEAARAIQEELDRRNIQSTVELPPDQATEDLNTIPTAEGDLITDFNLQAEQPIGLGEVVSGEDLMQQVQNNEQDLSGQEQAQPQEGAGQGTATGQEVPQVSEGPATEAPNRDRIAEGLQDLRPQLVERARRAGVEDPETVAQDAIIKASTAKTLEEARKFANSTAIQQSVSDALRRQSAESRQAQGNAVSMQEETPTGTVGESIPGQELAPDEEVQRNERRAIVESARDEFYKTLNPKEQELWHKIHTPGTGRVPKPSEIQQIAVKFSKFLKDKGHRSFGEGVESKAVPPVGWKPNTSAEIAKLTQDYALDKGLQATLVQIARKSKTPYKRYLARILQRQQGREIGVVPRAYGKWRPYDGLFGYDKGKPSIILNLTNIKEPEVLENVVLHELIHGQTLDLIDLHRESPELLSDSQRATIEKLNGLLDTARKAILGSDQKVEQFLRDAKADRNYFSQPTARQLYGLSSLEEFVSETMSNAEFIEMLKNIQVPGEGVSMWTKVVEFIKELLEITTPNTAAAAAFEQILALVDEGKRFAQLEGRVPPSRRILTPAMSPAVMSPTSVRQETRSLEASRSALSSRTQNFLNDKTYVRNFMAEERERAVDRIAGWIGDGLELPQMVDEVLKPAQPFSGVTVRDQLATASLLMEEIIEKSRAETNPVLKDMLIDQELKLASNIASVGTSAGETLQAMNHFREKLSGLAYIKSARKIITEAQEKMLPEPIKKKGKQAVKDLNEENAKAAKSEKVKKKVEDATISIETALKRAVTKIKGLEKTKEALSKAGRDKKTVKKDKAKSQAQEPMPLKFQYEDDLAKGIAKGIVRRFRPTDKNTPPLQDFYSKVSALIKEKIPADQKLKVPEASTSTDKAIEFIQFLTSNREAVMDSVIEAREQIYREASQAGLDTETQKMIDDLAEAIVAPDIVDIDFDQIVKDEIKNVRDLVQDHYSKITESTLSLTDKILSRLPQLSFAEASRIAQEVERSVQSEAKKAKETLLNRLLPKEKATEQARKAIPELIRLSNIGALTEEKYYNAVAEKMGLPAFTQEMGRKLTEWANRIQEMTEGRKKNREVQAFHDYVFRESGLKWSEIIQGYWYGAIFSGLGTQGFNAFASFNRLASELTAFAVANPGAAKEIAGGAIFGYLNAASDFGDIVKRGDYSAVRNSNPEVARNALEQITANDGAVKRVLSNMKYVQRFMAAVDLLNASAATEARMRLRAYLTTKEGEPQASKQRFNQAMMERLNLTPEQIKGFEEQALSEGLSRGTEDFNQRVLELREQAIDPEMLKEGINYSLDVTGNREVNNSLMGFIAKRIQDTARASKGWSRYIFPVTTVVANQTDDWINYTPFGLPRLGLSEFAKRVQGDEAKAKRRLLLPEDATDIDVQLIRAKIIIGNAIFMGIAAAILGLDDPDKEGYFDLLAAGPDSPEDKSQWMSRGGKTYSLKVGDRYFSYLASPFGMMFGMLGGLRDSQRYGNLSDRDAVEKFTIMTKAGMNMPLDLPVLQTFSDILTALHDKNNLNGGKKLTQIATGWVGSFYPNLAKEAESVLQPNRAEANSSWQYVLKNLPIMGSIMGTTQPMRNMYGEEIKIAPPLIRRFVGIEKEGPIWDAAKHILEVGTHVPVPDRSKMYFNTETRKNEPIPQGQFNAFKKAFGESIKAEMEIAVTREGNGNPLNIADKDKMDDLMKIFRDHAYIKAFKATGLRPPVTGR